MFGTWWPGILRRETSAAGGYPIVRGSDSVWILSALIRQYRGIRRFGLRGLA